MYDGIKLFLEWVGYFFIAYLIGYSTFLFLSVVVGSLELYKHRRQEMFKSILPSDYYLPISIIVPAYNEEVTVADTVRSLLTLEYRAYEIIVVDDGSKDRTSEVLAETFDMHLVHRPIRRQINCQREEYVYETRAQKVPVTLIRKKNGGKADALNMGINAANFPYFICMDADSVLQYDSLRRIAQPVLEDGKVVAVNHNANTAGGKSVTVEYSREDGSKVQCSYLHLSDIAVKVGDVVNASQKLGVSGNTGTRTTGEHLHFGVKSVSADGSKRDMDPAAYLAEIGQKGNIKLQALHNGNDLLAKYKSNAPQEQKVSSEDWMKKILSSEDSGVGISGTNDPILDMAMTTFMSLMMLAAQIDSNDEERQKGLISAMAANRLVDLTSLVPGMRQCTITVGENGKTVLHAESGTVKIDRELTSSEMNRLSLILGNANLSEESKRTKIAGMVTGIVATQQASQNFEQGMEAESQQQNLQRK